LTKIFPKYFREGIGKNNILCLLLNQPLEYAGTLISTQEHYGTLQSAQESLMRTQEYSGALMNTHKYVAMVPQVLMSAVKAKRKSANECLLVVMTAFGIFAPY